MTRARALKTIIRTRATKTGERYTAARRHVLREIEQSASARSTQKPDKLRRDAAHSVRGGMSDATSRAKTGHGLDHWFEVLDRFDAVAKGHTAAAGHLYDTHKVDGWYAQGITVAYERARGVRAVNQRCDGEFEVSVSKVVTAGLETVIKALSDARQRKRWSSAADAALVSGLSKALASPASKGFVVKSNGEARYRYKWDDTTIQFNLYPKAGGKISVVVSNLGLGAPALVEDRRAKWRTALGALGTFLTAKD